MVSSFTHPKSIYDKYKANLSHNTNLNHEDESEKITLVDQIIGEKEVILIPLVSQPIYDNYHGPCLKGYISIDDVTKCENFCHAINEVMPNCMAIETPLSKHPLILNHVRSQTLIETFS